MFENESTIWTQLVSAHVDFPMVDDSMPMLTCPGVGPGAQMPTPGPMAPSPGAAPGSGPGRPGAHNKSPGAPRPRPWGGPGVGTGAGAAPGRPTRGHRNTSLEAEPPAKKWGKW